MQVSKRLVLLYLHESSDSPGHDTPACLDFFTVSAFTFASGVSNSC